MAGQIDEGDDFGGFGADLDPIERSVFWLIDYIAAAVESKNVVANRRRSPRFNFVFVTKQFLTSQPSAVV